MEAQQGYDGSTDNEPAYIDLQVNGYVGVDFNDPSLPGHDLKKAASAMIRDSVQLALPTVITGAPESMLRCISNIRIAIEETPEIQKVFAGIHIEGPFLSPVKGYIGAHPKEHASSEDLGLLERLLDAAGPWAKIVTLAPEIDPQARMTKLCRQRGVMVAAGHTDATLAELETCIEAGLQLFMHLGNGCPRLMDRHDNIIYRALRFSDRISYSLIADGFHLPETLFRNLMQWIPINKRLVVSDAISAAGLGPGDHRLGNRTVRVGEDGACRDASGEHFVGSASTLRDANQWLTETLGVSAGERNTMLEENARRLLG